jgi:hypothetical protein
MKKSSFSICFSVYYLLCTAPSIDAGERFQSESYTENEMRLYLDGLSMVRRSDNSKFYEYLFMVDWKYEVIHPNKSEDYTWINRADSVRLRIDGTTYSISLPDTASRQEGKRMNVDLFVDIPVLMYLESQKIGKELIEAIANAKSYLDVEFYGWSNLKGEARVVFSLKRSDMAQMKLACQKLLEEQRRYISSK